MKKTLATVACALVMVTSLSLLPNMPKHGPFAVDTVSAATDDTTPAPAPAATSTPTKSTSTKTTTSYTTGNVSSILTIGSVGNAVKSLQTNLNNKGYKLDVDGFFGKLTLSAVKKFQTDNNLAVDGLVGPKTMAVIDPSTAVPKSIAIIGSAGNDVNYLQANLNKLGYKLTVDGIFGKLTQAAVRSFQSANGLVVDGIAGPKTFGKLFDKVSTPTPAPVPVPTPTPTTPATPAAGQVSVKIGRSEFAAHGTNAVAIAIAALAGDKIVAVSVDEYQFMDPTKIAVQLPNTAGLGANYKDATKLVLASKLRNTVYYSANMAKSGGATQTWDTNMSGIEKFATGKTISELEQIASTNPTDPKVDAVASATFASTTGYLNAIVSAAKDAKENTSVLVDNSQLSNLKIGRAEAAAHGTNAFTVAAAVTLGDKIVADSVDEYQFMDPTKIAVQLPNTAGLGANYKDATKLVLASKLRNTVYYSANMAKSGGATQTWDVNMAGVTKFVTGKTTSELEQIISTNPADPKVDAVASATFSSTNGYLTAIDLAAKAAK